MSHCPDDQLKQVLAAHAVRYLQMRPCDAVKLVFQNEFGGGHLISDPEASLSRLREEYAAVQRDPTVPLLEPIGNGMVRVMLSPLDPATYPLEALNRDFVRSAREHTGTRAAFLQKLNVLRALAADGIFSFSPAVLESYLAEYRQSGFPPVSHSPEYRAAYHPAYRVILADVLPPAYKHELGELCHA